MLFRSWSIYERDVVIIDHKDDRFYILKSNAADFSLHWESILPVLIKSIGKLPDDIVELLPEGSYAEAESSNV